MSTAPSQPSLAQRLQRFAPERVTTPLGDVEFRRAGPGVQGATHVLLHGIGSGSGSWLMQLEAAVLTKGAQVLAWEAPGYGHSSPVLPEVPDAGDYAGRLWAWLDKLEITQPVTLVGHSLGALMAARAAVQRPHQVRRLVLLSPAQGYARASPEERAKKLGDRLNNLNTLGVQGMAQKRGAAMLSPNADAERVAYVQSIMAQVHPAGYTQASHLLVGGDLLTDLAHITCPVAVASGRADTITPVAGCQKVAEAAGVPWTDLGDAGHACALDAAAGVNAVLGLVLQPENIKT
ncbi:MAG: alpha/beta fold hydrolase [Polaromonas sp.]|uniref:alpha/beta fold hydrolase n=1 Tax=Polaromonas sp. TaxID=1869339 RepID=UPI0025D0682B|nr:alpha/beta fold hydrolase [Polaromonas sp.]MBI2727976.1 alpha/beta fold hydrolase [Polaromonas sp.]